MNVEENRETIGRKLKKKQSILKEEIFSSNMYEREKD